MMPRGLRAPSSIKPTATIASRKLSLTLSATVIAAAALAALGWRLSAADVGPRVPPLADLEAALTGADPIVRIVAPAAGPAGPTTGPTIRPAPMSSVPPHQGLDPATRTALAAESAAPAINRRVEIRRGDTLMALLTQTGIERREAHAAITALSKVYSPRQLKPGQSIRLTLMPETRDASGGADSNEEWLRLVSLTLSASPVEDVHVARRAEGTGYLARAEARPLERRTISQSGAIDSSLFEAAMTAGIPTDVVIKLIRLFSFDVDFQREVQPGDRFEVLYDSFHDRAGALAKTDPLKYAAMVLSGKRLEFYHFVAADGTDDYFSPKGQSVRRALLRTPVDGARISSGYGLRRHPIQGYTKMHRGVDFAASRGTPIYAAGQGTVEALGRNGGYGKYIRLRHNSTYKTAYAHMKSYASGLKRGARVRQGQVIGYVGSTGNSTGPHLHYEVLRNGKQVNPRKIKLPSGKKLTGADLEAFQLVRADVDRLRGEALGAALIAKAGCAGRQAAPSPASSGC